MASKFVHIFVILAIISTALAIRCYKCDSSENALCAYGIARLTYNSVDCDEEAGGGFFTNWIPKQCVKLVAQAKNGDEYIARGCMPNVGSGVCNAIAKSLSFFGSIEGEIKDMNCYPCDGDKCNSAHKYTGYTMFGVVLAALVFLL